MVGPLIGKVADIWGQRRVYMLGLAGAIVFASLTAIAWNSSSLIAFRVLGAGEGAATGPASLGLIMRVFPEEDRVKAMGWWSMVGAGAPVIGVVAGGPVVQAFGWRWIFVAQVPLTLATLFLASAVLPDVEGDPHSRFDLPGAAALGGAPGGLEFGAQLLHEAIDLCIHCWVGLFAGRVHGFYHDCRVIGTDVASELTQARLWLVEASRIGLAIGLGLLGVGAPESM